ncbi:RNA 2',3'-cyclic phosphodiesterase [Bacillus gobiensis]|uniref:RNA 2',3'-cyclic phosphodiesterase n=1 Tax=Bacillus gobiensis TaxID=1441095 RepID=UPI003D2065CB
MDNNTYHYFIGIPFPLPMAEKIHEKLVQSPAFSFGKYVHPADYHLTLVFLGKADDAQLHIVAKNIKEIAGKTERIPLHFMHTNVFGDARRPRIFFIRPEHSDVLMDLREEVKQVAEEAGFYIEKRPFKPHVTIAKKWKQEGPYPGNAEADQLFDLDMKDLFDRITIFKTHLNKSPMYESIYTSELKGSSF